MLHDIWAASNVHPNWMVLQVDIANAFNIVSHVVIFQKLCAANGQLSQLIHFVHLFYAPQLLLFFNHHYIQGDLSII